MRLVARATRSFIHIYIFIYELGTPGSATKAPNYYIPHQTIPMYYAHYLAV